MNKPIALTTADCLGGGAPRTKPGFQWRALVSVTVVASFAFLLVSGVGLWFAPPGRIANWTDWTIFGLNKHEWADLHIWFALVFVVVSGFHLALNWRPLLGYFKTRLTRHFGFRREWIVALIVCGGVFVGTRTDIPPFSTFLNLTERVQGSWEQKNARPPIPHAELLTLSQLTQQAGISLTNALARLKARGIKSVSQEIRVSELAELNRVSAQHLYEIITAGQSGKQDVGRDGGRGGGGGLGLKTLAAFCQEEGIELQVAQRRLRAKGIEVSDDMTLREIAEGSGQDRPYQILQIIRNGQDRNP